MTRQTDSKQTAALEDGLRSHSYDGIQEYDKRLPRWWLLTLYGAMVFAFVYWAYYQTYRLGLPADKALVLNMAENAAKVARKAGVLDDNAIYRMSRDAQTVAAGKATFDSTCAACHKPDLTGLIGPNLVDREWIHGGHPMDAIKTITEGSLLKGMPAWGPMLGTQKITELTAYIFSHHEPGEPIVAVPAWVPPTAPVSAP